MILLILQYGMNLLHVNYCSAKENNSNNKVDNLKCVINAQPLLLEECPRADLGMSMCYTVEFNDDTGTVLYGCTATMQVCCPHTTTRETILFNETDGNKSEVAVKVPELKRAAVDGNLPQVNDGSSGKSVRSSWGLISGVVCGAVLMVCLVGAAGIFINRRRRQKHQAAVNAHMGEPTALRAVADEGEDGNENLSGMVCTPGEKLSTNVIHSDRTDTVVPAQLTVMEQDALLQTMKKSCRLKAVVRGKKPPTITRVITYATSDDITNVDRSSKDEIRDLSQDPSRDLLTKLIRNGPKQFQFKYEELRDILMQGSRIFLEEPTLLEVPIPCTVYGDTHGQYSDLHRWFNLNGWPSQVRSVFLGDFVDRGSHGIEVVALLTALKVRFPKNIFLCRGNHEEESLNRAYSFHDEVCIRFPENPEGKDGRTLYPFFRAMFNNLPLAVLIGGRILGMHGGIGPRLTSLQAIREIRRPLEEFEVGTLECDLVWSDPDTTPDRTGFRSNLEREPVYGIGQLFAPDTVQNLCTKLGIDMIIRGHQAPLHGYALFSGGCMLTLFSAPGYKGVSNSDINMGASIEISSSMNIVIKQIQVTEKFRQKRIVDTEQRKTNSSKNKQQNQSPAKSTESPSLSTSSLFR